MEMCESVNKYYTPIIEEFHVGFEYEYNSNTFEEPIWKLSTYDTLDFVSHSYDDCEFDSSELLFTRVKYLDKEDIESLGFEFKKSTNSPSEPTHKHFFDVYMLGNGIKLSHYNWFTGAADTATVERRGVRIEYITDPTDRIMFRGTIKNRSELKTLLKQLGIV